MAADKPARAKKDPRKRPTPQVERTGAASDRKPRRGEKRDPVDERSGARIIGGPRNEHGTRVSRRITCSRCHNIDHVPYVPRDEARALCRNCAAEMLKTYEQGVKVRMPTRTTPCNLCGTPFELPIAAEDDGDPLCSNCLRGFTTWQGSVDVPFTERQNTVVEARLSGALVRKKKS